MHPNLWKIVDLRQRSCTCTSWVDLQFPCQHALVVINKLGLDIRLYYPPGLYESKSYCTIYLNEVLASPAVDLGEDDTQAPPIPATKPGPKETKRIPSNGMN